MKNMNNIKIKNKFIFVILLLLILIVLSLFLGSTKLSIKDCLIGLFTNDNNTFKIIMRNIRLPRILGAIIAGSGLAVSGLIIQTITDNGLASPNIIGVNSGAGFITIIILSIIPSLINYVAIGSFVGAMLTTIFILFISSKISNSKMTIILAGMAVTTLLNAGISFISMLDTSVLDTYKYFSVGGLNGISIKQLILPLIFILISIVLLLIMSNKIEILILGDNISKTLGLNVNVIKIISFICASLLAASVVSFAGLLGFVGLIIPHISRKLIGYKLKDNIIMSLILGAIIVLLADTIGRIILYPTEIPVGIVMAFIGCPFFIYLLFRSKSYARN